jgi:hypothetical protein
LSFRAFGRHLWKANGMVGMVYRQIKLAAAIDKMIVNASDINLLMSKLNE